jgi:hypothetical protein
MLYPCFTLIYGDLPMIPFILFITLQDRKTLFCVFLPFRDLNEVKWSWAFGSVNISSREAPGALGPHQMSQEAQKRPGGAPSKGGRATHALFLLDRRFASIFRPPPSYDLKTNI